MRIEALGSVEVPYNQQAVSTIDQSIHPAGVSVAISRKCCLPTQDFSLSEYSTHDARMLLLQRGCVMNRVHVLGGVACLSLLLATGAMAEILGVQPGTSDNPKDNVPKEIQRDGGTVSPGISGPGTRSDELVGMKQEKPEPITLQDLEQNVEKTQGGGAAIAAEDLKKEGVVKSDKDLSDQSSPKGMK